MSTSIHESLIAFAASLYGTDDDAVSTVVWRDGICNGLLHAGDSYAQVRVNFNPPALGGNDLDHLLTIDESPVANSWYPIAQFGQWPLTLRADGTPYRLRVRIGGCIASGVTANATFRVVIAPGYSSALEGRYEASDRVFEAVASGSSTPAWLSGTSQGINAAANYLDVPVDDARAWIRDVAAYDAVSAASPVSVQQCLVSAYVFAQTDDGGILPQLYALHLAEYIAP